MQISLRAGERIYINGAVLRADRKVSIELMNDVTFLMEHHVLLAEHATTPLRQLYFIVQTLLIEPIKAAQAHEMFERSHALLLASFENEEVIAGLYRVHQLVSAGRAFDALKAIRGLYPIEERILGRRASGRPDGGAQQHEEVTWK